MTVHDPAANSSDNEELLRLAFEIARVGTWRLDLVSQEVSCTSIGKQHFGLAPEATLSFERILELIHPEDRDAVRRAVTEAAANRSTYEVEYRIPWPDGDTHWIIARGRLQYDSAGKPVRLISTTYDISERKQARQALLEMRSRLTRAMDYGHVGTWAIEWPQESVYTDAYLARLFSVAPEDEQGGPLQHYLDAIHRDDRADVAAAIANAFAQRGGYHELEYRIVQPDGSTCWVQARYQVECRPSGEPLRLAGVLLEINDRKRAEQALRASEEKLRLAVQVADIGIWDHDVDAGTLTWSPRCKAIFGLPADAEIDYELYMSRIHPDDRDTARRAVQRAQDPAGDGNYPLTCRTLWPDGSVHWFSSTGHYLFAGEGASRRAVRGIGAVFDITERKRAEVARTRQQEIDRFMNEAGSILAGSLDYDATLAQVAQLCVPTLADWAFVDLLDEGHTLRRVAVAHADPAHAKLAAAIRSEPPPPEPFGNPLGESLLAGRPLLLPDIGDTLRQALAAEPVPPRLLLMAQAIGNRPASLISVPLVARGKTLGMLSLLATGAGHRYDERDLGVVEELARRAGLSADNARLYQQAEKANAALREQAAALAAADRRKDEFLAMLAHELRNPLVPLANNLQLARMADPGSDMLEKARGTMARQLAHMVRLIDDLMDVSRITRGTIELRKERIALADVIQAAVETSRPLIAAREHALAVELPPEPLYLEGDMTRLTQVFSNLLNNASKFTPPHGRIRLAAAGAAGRATVTVRDTGVGIPPDKLNYIFEMFTQIDDSLERAYGGLGIGLALVRRLVELHGGDVSARSGLSGGGSEFIVHLPLAAQPEAEAPAPVEPTLDRIEKQRILVVDDNHDVADSTSMLLEMLGSEVRTVYNGVEALEVAAEFHPDAILLDIGMPDMSGYTVARRVRAQPWGRDVKLIAVTGWGQEDDRQRSRAAGFDLHLVKPVDVAVVKSLLEGTAPAAV